MLESRYQIVTEGLQELYRRASSGECIDWDTITPSTKNATYKILSKLGMFQSGRALEFNEAGGHNIAENPMLQQSLSCKGSSGFDKSAESESNADSASSATSSSGTSGELELAFHYGGMPSIAIPPLPIKDELTQTHSADSMPKPISLKDDRTPVPFLQIAADSDFEESFQCKNSCTFSLMDLIDASIG